MKRYTFLLGFLLASASYGQSLLLVPRSGSQAIHQLATTESCVIHHIGKDFVLATCAGTLPAEAVLLTERAWDSGRTYFLVWLPGTHAEEALSQLQEHYTVLHADGRKAIVEAFNSQPNPMPFVHGGVVRISETNQWFPDETEDTRYVVDTFPIIYDLMALVDTGAFMPSIRQLESYGTRFCESIKAFQAQEWIQEQFEQYPGLEITVQDFPYYGGFSSDNVIAVLPGKVYPDEYIAVGAHYDSFSFGGAAPGADDNASGTAAVLELARIMSQYEWDRSIVFCTFSAEEVGLIGSAYYASQAQAQGMDILGYFNFDMIGYRHGSDPIHTDMIAPPSALELVNFYKDVVAIYLPGFNVYDAQLSGGDSDHTSFNNNGYMGIFPFEDVPNYSPYIHTPQDLVGPSVNSPEMASTFIQANLASIATLSVPYVDPIGIEPFHKEAFPVKIFPNPATRFVQVVTPGRSSAEVTVLSGMGQPLLHRTLTGQATLDLSSLSPGCYVVRTTSGGQAVHSRLIVSPAP